MSKFQNPDGKIVDEVDLTYYHHRRVEMLKELMQEFFKQYTSEEIKDAQADLGWYPEDHVSEYMREKILEECDDNEPCPENYHNEGWD